MREIKFRALNNKFKEFKFMSLINYIGGQGITDDWADSENIMLLAGRLVLSRICTAV